MERFNRNCCQIQMQGDRICKWLEWVKWLEWLPENGAKFLSKRLKCILEMKIICAFDN